MTAPHPRAARTGSGLRLLRAAVFAALCVVLAAAGHTLASCATVPLWTLGAGFLGTLALVAPLTGRARSLPGIVALLAVMQTVLHTLFGLGQHGGSAMSGGSMSGSSMSSMPSMSSMSMSDTTLVERAARLVCGAGAAQISPAHAYKILTDAHLSTSAPATGTSGAAHAADATGASGSLLPSVPMLLGHVLAAVVAGWLLRRGDLALLRLIQLSADSAHGVAEGALIRALRGALALGRALCAGLVAVPEAPARDRRGAWDIPQAPRTVALQHSVIRRGPPVAAAVLVLAA
ncbi:hypothetical protein ABT215_17660 [Streptomyces sp900105755]|uniref:hypothetical protein n=1 Tax=unclassified Streptomyces TaxID=2593676 RepID=UPI00089A902B|nr:hypothetical protein [Streptomyces sp. Ag109_O5-10]SEE92004.1 hypothetical protein SAMN05216533_4374 [Streptomyces sp. Ag109_O5-10]